MTNWQLLFNSVPKQLKNFALGNTSGRELLDTARSVGSDVSGETDRLLRNRGVVYARRLARKAMRRRGFSV